MATYVNNLRLTELATGEGSGTWGTTTNTNLELIGEALGYGSEAIANASTHTITVADGTADSARSFYLKLTGGGQACTVTLAPNTLSKVWMVENTTNSTLTFSQGSGANVAVPAGQVKMIATDGAGSGAVVYDLLVDTDLTGTTTVVNLTSSGTIDAATVEFNSLSGTGSVAITDILDQDNMSSDSATALATQQSIKAYVDSSVASFDTLAEVLAQGNTTGSTDIEVTTAQKVQFRDSAIYINSSADGQLDIVADTEIQIAATTIDVNGNVDVSGTIAAGGVVTANAGVVVDTMTIDGSAIASTGSLGLDIGGNLTIDVDGTTITLADGGANWGQMFNSAQNFYFKNPTADKDIIFQGIDGSTAITMLTLDASLAGQATFGGNLTVQGADVTITGNVIHAGDTNTYFGFHDADQWRVVTGGTERIEITNTEVVINDSSVDMDFRVESDSNANMLLVNGGNNSVSIGTSTSEGTFTVGGSATFNADSADADFRVESNGQTHMLFVDGGNNRVGVGTNAPSAPFHSSNTSSGITARFSNDVNQTLDIGTVSGTGANGSVYIDNANSGNIQLRTGNAERLNILASGNITIKTVDSFLYSPASSGGTYIDAGLKFESSNKKLEFWTADAERMSLASDGAATFSSTIAATSATFTTADNLPQLTLISTDADANAGPLLVLDRQSASPADGDSIGTISFNGKNDAAEAHGYAKIEARIVDASNATEDGRLELMTSVATEEGISRVLMNATETVINDNSKDLDFRVESDGNANMLFVDGGNNRVGIANSAPEYPLDVTGVIQSGDQISVSGSRNLSLNYSNGTISGIGGYYGSGGMVLGYGVWPKSGAGSFVSSSSVALSRQAIHLNGYDFDMYSGTNQTVAVDGDVSLALHAKLSGIAGYVFNEASADIDFRVESNSNANALFVDAGNNRITMGGNDGTGSLTVKNTDNSGADVFIHAQNDTSNRIAGFKVLDEDGDAQIVLQHDNGSDTPSLMLQKENEGNMSFSFDGSDAAVASNSSSAALNLKTSSTTRMSISVGGGITTTPLDEKHAVFNEGSANSDFRVESNDNANMLIVDGGDNRVNIGGSGSGQVSSAFYVEGRTTLYNGSTTGGSVILTDGYTPASNDHILNIGTQRSSGGPFMSYGLGQFGNADGLWKSTYDNFSGTHSVIVLNGSTLEYYLDTSDSATTVGDTVTVISGYKVGRAGAIFNDDSSSSLDFRVESDSNANMLFVDAGNNTVNLANDVFGEAPTVTGGKFVHFNTTSQQVASGGSSTVNLFTRSPDANVSATGTVFIAAENSGGSVQFGAIIDFFFSNGTLNTTARETGSSQGTATMSVQENGAAISVTVAYAGGIGGAIKYSAGGQAAICSY